MAKKPDKDKKSGKFIAQPDSLGKVFGVRLPKDREQEFIDLAESEGISTAELARQILIEKLDSNNH